MTSPPHDPAPRLELQELYEAAYARLVGVVGAVCGSRQDAEEAVQEAFIALMGHWDEVSMFDDPEAWVRKVALRKSGNRRRKLRNGLRAQHRDQPPAAGDVTVDSDDRLDLHRALDRLPVAQREALVLHHLLDLPVDVIAAELRVPASTVKARLARGRAALATPLREDMSRHA